MGGEDDKLLISWDNLHSKSSTRLRLDIPTGTSRKCKWKSTLLPFWGYSPEKGILGSIIFFKLYFALTTVIIHLLGVLDTHLYVSFIKININFLQLLLRKFQVVTGRPTNIGWHLRDR